jgi:hypothetical protein
MIEERNEGYHNKHFVISIEKIYSTEQISPTINNVFELKKVKVFEMTDYKYHSVSLLKN